MHYKLFQTLRFAEILRIPCLVLRIRLRFTERKDHSDTVCSGSAQTSISPTEKLIRVNSLTDSIDLLDVIN